MSQCPHRVGQLYLSFDATSPEAIWPGTRWTRITGRFLRAAADTATGGSDNVALTESHLPRHSHTGPSHSHPAGTLAASSAGAHSHTPGTANVGFMGYATNAAALGWANATNSFQKTNNSAHTWYKNFSSLTSAGAHAHGVTGSTGAAGTGSTGTTGGGTAFDNRPAFQDVHVWRRTA